MKCPYKECTFVGTQAQVDDHVVYMTSVVQDKEHEPGERFGSEAPAKWGVWCVRGSNSVVGPGQAWMKDGGKVLLYDTEAEARREANRVNKQTTSINLHYSARKFSEAILDEK